MACFGKYFEPNHPCDSCKVRNSCKKFAIKNYQIKQTRKVNPNKFTEIQKNKIRAQIIFVLLCAKSPLSTYRITRILRNEYKVDTNDKMVKALLENLAKHDKAHRFTRKQANYWISGTRNI